MFLRWFEDNLTRNAYKPGPLEEHLPADFDSIEASNQQRFRSGVPT